MHGTAVHPLVRDTFSTKLTCHASELAGLRRRLREWLGAHALPEDSKGSIVLAVHEAAANAIEHSSPCRFVGVRATIGDGDVTIDVIDAGKWRRPRPRTDERGRGLTLIGTLMRHVEIRSDGFGTTVRMQRGLT